MSASSPWKNRIIRRADVAPDQLLANPFNFRTHSRFQQDTMLSVMAEIGWIQDVIVNLTTGHVIDGHMRIILAMRHEESTVPVVYVKLTEEEEKIVLATYDHIGGMAGTDHELFDQLLEDMKPQDDNLRKILDGLSPKRNKNPLADDITEEAMSPELFERQDYLVISFDSEFDWQAACKLLGIDLVVSQPVGKRTLRQRGLSRVITGKAFLGKVQNGTNHSTGSVDSVEGQLAQLKTSEEGERPSFVGAGEPG